MNTIIKFWKNSYNSHPTAFYYEMISAITVIIGSGILTFTVLDPRPDLFIPFYWLGSTTGFVGAYYRNSAWVMVLTFWFTAMNTIALWRLFI
tara:strand:- start:985 stop:1260 length:276 start_codon:yes stop_codon:yes gene_type:complete